MEAQQLSFMLPHSILPQGTEKDKLEKLMISSPFSHCPLPGSLPEDIKEGRVSDPDGEV